MGLAAAHHKQRGAKGTTQHSSPALLLQFELKPEEDEQVMLVMRVFGAIPETAFDGEASPEACRNRAVSAGGAEAPQWAVSTSRVRVEYTHHRHGMPMLGGVEGLVHRIQLWWMDP